MGDIMGPSSIRVGQTSKMSSSTLGTHMVEGKGLIPVHYLGVAMKEEITVFSVVSRTSPMIPTRCPHSVPFPSPH